MARAEDKLLDTQNERCDDDEALFTLRSVDLGLLKIFQFEFDTIISKLWDSSFYCYYYFIQILAGSEDEFHGKSTSEDHSEDSNFFYAHSTLSSGRVSRLSSANEKSNLI